MKAAAILGAIAGCAIIVLAAHQFTTESSAKRVDSDSLSASPVTDGKHGPRSPEVVAAAKQEPQAQMEAIAASSAAAAESEKEARAKAYVRLVSSESLEDTLRALCIEPINLDFSQMHSPLGQQSTDPGFVVGELIRDPRVARLFLIAWSGDEAVRADLAALVRGTVEQWLRDADETALGREALMHGANGRAVLPLLLREVDASTESLSLLVELSDTIQSAFASTYPRDELRAQLEAAVGYVPEIDDYTATALSRMTGYAIQEILREYAEDNQLAAQLPGASPVLQVYSDYVRRLSSSHEHYLTALESELGIPGSLAQERRAGTSILSSDANPPSYLWEERGPDPVALPAYLVGMEGVSHPDEVAIETARMILETMGGV